MMEQEQCKNCGSRQNCGTVYKKMGEYKGPSVLGKVVLAFVVPLLVFIVSLVVMDKLLSYAAMAENLKTLLNFGIASGITLAVILVIRFKNGSLGKIDK
jgi:hypothetical protein